MWLVLLFGILCVVFGVWSFGFAATVAWDGIRIIFYVCLALLVLSFIGWIFGTRGSPVP